jgi:hypothetical protein
MTANDLVLYIDRGRVHAGDEEYPPFHMIRETRALRADVTVGEAVDAVTRGRGRYGLASVAGRATWVLYGGLDVEKPYADGGVALAVISHLPKRPGEPRLLVDPDLALSSLASADGSVGFFFRYLCSADPRQTWRDLHEGQGSDHPRRSTRWSPWRKGRSTS